MSISATVAAGALLVSAGAVGSYQLCKNQSGGLSTPEPLLPDRVSSRVMVVMEAAGLVLNLRLLEHGAIWVVVTSPSLNMVFFKESHKTHTWNSL